MRTFACVIFILLQPFAVLPQKPIDHGGKIETKYDGFSFETVMRLQRMKVNCTGFKGNFQDYCVSMDVTLHCPGIQVSHVRSVTLQLIFETGNWNEAHPPDQRELSIVSDTKTLRLGKMRLIPKANAVLQEKTIETLEATLSYDVFKKIAQSESLKMQVGRSAFELRDKNLAALRDLDNRVIKTQ
jgi:hypothetical protein